MKLVLGRWARLVTEVVLGASCADGGVERGLGQLAEEEQSNEITVIPACREGLKVRVNTQLLRAGWDNDYLMKVLGIRS